jgi:hypothetical protein
MSFSRRPGIESGVDIRERGLLRPSDMVTAEGDRAGQLPRFVLLRRKCRCTVAFDRSVSSPEPRFPAARGGPLQA